ncbi:NAD(+)/NADH kinase [Candidatus Woesearchaeota archaeon]|nr:NAD(+)/NADH kinase [Candidatus Woesearchaeota archaeon]
MKLKNVLVVYTLPTTKEYDTTLKIVKNILKKYKIRHHLANRDLLNEIRFHSHDFVLAVGGDGTFLRAAQFIKKQLIFGVNADVKSKEGFFMESSKNDFEKKLKKIIDGKFKIRRLPRLEAHINGKKIGSYAVNEFYIGPKKGYHASKYVIELGKTRERQKSSGILAATPAGSHAWASASFNMKLPLNSKNFQFVVREPYEGKVFKNYRLKRGILKKRQKLKIYSEMLDGAIVADSVGKEFAFSNGSSAVVSMSNNYLNMVAVK